jgi:glycosyltransferase involved in cell wall biosynthesis
MKIGITLGEHFMFKQGGAEVQVSLLINEFIKKGHDVFYVCYGDNDLLEPEVCENGLRLYMIQRPFRGYNFMTSLRKKKLYSILDKEKPDILYQRGNYHFWDLISKYGSKNSVPVVSCLSMEKHCKKVKPKLGPSFFFDVLTERMKIRYYDRSSLIISQTQHQKEMMKKHFQKDSEIIENGHPVPNGPFEKDSPKKVVWVANIKPIKQPEKFIQLARELGDRGFDFVMIGRSGKGDYQSALLKEMKRIKDLSYLGELPLEETNDQISRSSILVNTSSSEGFSNTYIQAWLRETPVVTLNADPDGMIERFELGRKSGNITKLIEDVRELLTKEELLTKIRMNSREYAMKRFNIEDKGNRYIDLFNTLL